ARASNQGHIARRVEKGRLSEEKAREALERVRETTDLREAERAADFVIEAVCEDLDVKRSIFHDLDELAPAHAVLASNSSTIGISKIADATRRPDRCLNMHFFYPVLVMDLVEVVRGPQTSDETIERGMALAREMGRTPVLLKKEIDGFIVNRILHAATQEAYRLLDADVASFEDIDAAIRLYMTVFGAELTHRASNEKDGLAAAFLRAGDAEVELLAPLREDTPVGKFLAKRGPGLHHIAVAVPDIDRAIADARAKGLEMIDQEPRIGLHGTRIAFVQPKSVVGKVGVAIDSLEDMEILLKDIPLDRVSTSMTINATASMLLLLYQLVAEKQGCPPEKITGTVQNDILKEYAARGTYIFPPKPSMRLITDLFAYCAR